MIRASDKARVYIETADGMVYDITGYVSQVVMSVDVRGYTTTDMTLIGSEPLVVHDHMNMKNAIKLNSSIPEWECSYCHRPNKRERETCESCDAVRSFIYG